MKTLTEKQQKFAAYKAAGIKNREAAIAAGYAPNNADVQAANMLRREDIKAAVKAARPDAIELAAPRSVEMPKAHYADAKTFLEDVMNNKSLPIAMRADAAKQLLPYMHARVGEAGKKATAKNRAHEVARTNSRFLATAPPAMLRAIEGGKGRNEE